MPTPSATSSRTNSPIGRLTSRRFESRSVATPGHYSRGARVTRGHSAASWTMTQVTPGMWSHLGERRAVWPGRNYPLGSTWSEESTNFAVYAPAGTRPGSASSTRTASRRDTADRAVARHLARRAARGRARHPLRLPGRRAVAARGGAAVQPAQAAARPLRPGGVGQLTTEPGGLRLRPGQPRRSATWRTPRRTSRAAWWSTTRFDWGDDRPDAPPLARHRDLRDARQGHDRAARPGARGAARDVRRPGDAGGHRLPARPRRDRGRAAARPPVRLRARAGRARADSTTGATTRSASSPRTTPTPPPATAAGRSPSSSRWSRRSTTPGSR